MRVLPRTKMVQDQGWKSPNNTGILVANTTQLNFPFAHLTHWLRVSFASNTGVLSHRS